MFKRGSISAIIEHCTNRPDFEDECNRAIEDFFDVLDVTLLDLRTVTPTLFSLRMHKLSGRLHGLWSFSLDYKHRIIFRFLPDRTVLSVSVGDHSIYR